MYPSLHLIGSIEKIMQFHKYPSPHYYHYFTYCVYISFIVHYIFNNISISYLWYDISNFLKPRKGDNILFLSRLVAAAGGLPSPRLAEVMLLYRTCPNIVLFRFTGFRDIITRVSHVYPIHYHLVQCSVRDVSFCRPNRIWSESNK